MPSRIVTHHRRSDFGKSQLLEQNCEKSPSDQFAKWFNDAVAAAVEMPEAFCLSTVGTDGIPDARILLMREFDQRGFVFFTHLTSPKARQIKACPNAAMVFFWSELEQQIRVRGHVEPISSAESDEYFNTRPKASQLSTMVAKQSEIVKNRDVLDKKLGVLMEEFENRKVSRPDSWGGLRLKPYLYEFWQGGENRIHDRIRYRLSDDETWIMERLAP